MAKNQGGRPAMQHNPEIGEKIQAMAQYGVPLDGIAHLVGMSVNTLRKLYAVDLQKGVTLANMAVGKKLFERCMAGDVTSLIFWAKTRMGWRETDKKNEAQATENAARQMADAIRQAMTSVGK